MKRPWRRIPHSQPATTHLGLESIRFDTLGLSPQPDEDMNERCWLGPRLMLLENFVPIPPDFPSLEEDEIRTTYHAWMESQPPDAQGRRPRLLHLAVRRETPIPAVATLLRMVAPGDNRYSFVGAVTLPLADCSWVIKVQCDEGNPTGFRETLAGARFRQANGDSPEEEWPRFDPYDEQWDQDPPDPLTEVRRSTNRVLESLEVDPEVRQAKRFGP